MPIDETRGAAPLTLVLGGARSGKSRHAEALVTALPKPWLYIATGEPRDNEMAARIAEHRARRGSQWQTIEAPRELAAALAAVPAGAAVLIDCLTLWLSNVMLAGADVDAETARFAQSLIGRTGPVVLVANEVGLGIVPENALARRFRDAAGRLNQRLADLADGVVLLVAGIPMKVK
jgi:adenosylcobinamide kinase/adenosylcobinamide-phosphate guanylyltransferase